MSLQSRQDAAVYRPGLIGQQAHEGRHRHFMFAELQDRLYRARDAFSSALQEYDEVCARRAPPSSRGRKPANCPSCR